MPTTLAQEPDVRTSRRRVIPEGVDPHVKLLVQVIDDQHDGLLDEIRSFRRLAWAALAAGVMFGLLLTIALIETRGVDSAKVVDEAVHAFGVVTPTNTKEVSDGG